MAKHPTRYTLVQHSGMAFNADPTFRYAVEEVSVDNPRTISEIVRIGGLIFNTYAEARDRAMEENYTKETKGVIPRARGAFASKSIDGQRIYIPPQPTETT